MALTSKGLIQNCEKALKSKTAYMWGTYGNAITKSLISGKQKQYPARYSDARVKKLTGYVGKGYYGCDCAGLVKNYYFGGWGSVKYKSKYDRNCTGWLNSCTKTGKIAKLPEIPGLYLYMKGHCGVYAGNGYAYECTLGKYGDGVVKTAVKGRGWTHYGYLPDMEYPEATKYKKTTAALALRTKPSTKNGTRYFYIPKGKKVEILAENAATADGYSWDKVRYGGIDGYSANKYLKEV